MEETKEFDKEKLHEFRNLLPFGAIKVIAAAAGCTTKTVTLFFKGEVSEYSPLYSAITKAAKKLKRDYEHNAAKTKQDILKTLEENSNPQKLY